MRKLLVPFCLIIGLVGCEFDSSSSDDVPTGDVGVNVSGQYRDENGSFLFQVRGASGNTTINTQIGTGDGAQATFGGNLIDPVVATTVFVTDGNESFTDAAGDGTLTGTKGGNGTINYGTGAITVNFNSFVALNQAVTVRYDSVNPGTSGNPQQGNSGEPIFELSVVQRQNLLEITDDLGNRYQGRIEDPFEDFDTGTPTSDIRAVEEGRVGQPLLTRAIGLSYPFGVEGTANGLRVRIEGVFKAEVTVFFAVRNVDDTVTYEELFRRTTFTMRGTWIETDTGVSARINALGPSDQGAALIEDVGQFE